MQGLTTKIYEYLPKEALLLREEVFLGEQGFTVERDDVDDIATHIVWWDNATAVATCRLYNDDGFVVGRIAVKKEYRGQGLGREVLSYAENVAKTKGADTIRLHAQTRVVDFYTKCGYTPYGDIEYEEWCEHIWMRKAL